MKLKKYMVKILCSLFFFLVGVGCGIGYVNYTMLKGSNIQEEDIAKADYDKFTIQWEVKQIILDINPELTDFEADVYAYATIELSEIYNVPIEFILTFAFQESSWIPHIVSNKGCIGLLQINPKYWGRNIESLYNPIYNLELGINIFLEYLEESNGDFYTALIKYSGGTSRESYYLSLCRCLNKEGG